MSHSTFSIPLFTQLARRLQYTNARYNQIAYQCRRTQRPTYHAKRRACRVGLRIDTSKGARPEVHVDVSAASTALDRTARSSVWEATEPECGKGEESESSTEDACLPNPWPEMPVKTLTRVVVRERPATPSLSPLELGLSTIGAVETRDVPFRGPVPGAPRWRTRLLPEDSECETEAMTNQVVSFEATCTYDAIWRGVITTHVSDSVSMPLGVVYGGLGITVPACHKKRKLRELDVDESALISRRPEVGNDKCGLGLWWSEAQRRPRGGL